LMGLAAVLRKHKLLSHMNEWFLQSTRTLQQEAGVFLTEDMTAFPEQSGAKMPALSGAGARVYQAIVFEQEFPWLLLAPSCWLAKQSHGLSGVLTHLHRFLHRVNWVV